MREDNEALGPWDIYANEALWPISSTGVFLAEAVQLIGQAASVTWGRDVPSSMLIKPPPLIPEAEDAFDGELNPIPRIHELFADSVRSIKSPGAFEAECLSEADWLSSLVSDPNGGEPLPECALRAKLGQDCADPVSYDHWEHVSFQAMSRYHLHLEARRSMSLVARVFHSLVVQSHVSCSIRPVGGSIDGPSEFPSAYWEIDDPLPRLAWCGINLGAPLDAHARPTHWIFVDDEQLREALSGIQPVLFIDEGPAATKEPGYCDLVVEDIYRFLVDAFTHMPMTMSRPDFRRELRARTGRRVSETNWRDGWSKATKEFPGRSRKGRKPKK